MNLFLGDMKAFLFNPIDQIRGKLYVYPHRL
jgi:hypothetical protein